MVYTCEVLWVRCSLPMIRFGYEKGTSKYGRKDNLMNPSSLHQLAQQPRPAHHPLHPACPPSPFHSPQGHLSWFPKMQPDLLLLRPVLSCPPQGLRTEPEVQLVSQLTGSQHAECAFPLTPLTALLRPLGPRPRPAGAGSTPLPLSCGGPHALLTAGSSSVIAS